MKRFGRFLFIVLWAAVILVAGYTAYYFSYEDKAYDILYDDSLGQYLGPKDAERTLVAIIDYRCSHCRFMAPVFSELRTTYPDLKIVFKYLPVTEQSEVEFRLALAAGQLGKFEEAHDFLIGRVHPFTEEAFQRFLEETGLEEEDVNKTMGDEKITSALYNGYKAAWRLGTRSTPAFLYDGKVYTQFAGNPTIKDFSLLLGPPPQAPKREPEL